MFSLIIVCMIMLWLLLIQIKSYGSLLRYSIILLASSGGWVMVAICGSMVAGLVVRRRKLRFSFEV